MDQIPIYPSLTIPGSGGYVPWTESNSPYSASSTAPAGDYESAWSYGSSLPSTHEELFDTTNAGLEWSNYEPMDETWAPTINISSALMPTSTTAFSHEGGWGTNNPTLASPYSETGPDIRPPLTRSISADNGLGAGQLGLDYRFLATRGPATAPTSPGTQGSLLSPPSPTKAKKSPKPAAKTSRKSDVKSKSSSGSSDKTFSRRKSLQALGAPPKMSKAATELFYQAQLTARYGSKLGPFPPNQDPKVTTDQIRREAWRICKAEALEMSQRRMKLLEHDHGALERETQLLQLNVGRMREAIARQQAGLEDAVVRAERLDSY